MVKTLQILSLIFACSFGLQAQIDITSSDMPNLGDYSVVSQAGLPNVDLGIASNEAQMWDFTGLDNQGAAETVLFKPVDEIEPELSEGYENASFARQGSVSSLLGFPFGFLIPGGDGLPGTAFYEKATDGSVYTSGIVLDLPFLPDSLTGGGPVDLSANPNDLFMTPLAYGDIVSGSGSFSYTINLDVDTLSFPVPITIQLNTNKTIEADAFGQMALPDSTYDVLRYHENNEINMVAGVFFLGIPITTFIDTSITINSYRFMASGENYPIATLLQNPIDSLSDEIVSLEYKTMAGPLQASFQQNVSCLNVAFQNTSDGNPYAFNWDFGDGTTSILENPIHNYQSPGLYTVALTVVTPNGAEATTTKQIEVDFCLGVGKPLGESVSLNLYPNPTANSLQVNLQSVNVAVNNWSLSIYNMMGQQIWHLPNANAGLQTIDVSHLPAATYLLKATDNYTNNYKVSSFAIIK